MKNVPQHRYFDAIDATWAPARFEDHGPFTLRIGKGGGKRVSAATTFENDATASEIEAASSAMTGLNQDPLFMLKPGQDLLDDRLERLGFNVIDPVVLYAGSVEDLAKYAPPGIAVIGGDMPLAAQREIWSADGIGPARIEVMDRSSDPKGYLLGRHNDKIAGTVFVSCDQEIAMLHALAVSQSARRQGVGMNLTFGCARWAMQRGAQLLALVVTVENTPARQLYERIGMTEVSRYHYRIKSQ